MFHFSLRLKLGTLQSSPPTCCLSSSNCIERKKILPLLLLWPPHQQSPPFLKICCNKLSSNASSQVCKPEWCTLRKDRRCRWKYPCCVMAFSRWEWWHAWENTILLMIPSSMLSSKWKPCPLLLCNVMGLNGYFCCFIPISSSEASNIGE